MQNRLKVVFILTAASCEAARLRPSANRAFESYVADLESRLIRQHARTETYLAWLNVEASQRGSLERQLTSGEIRVEPVNGGTRQLHAALLHHWRGAAFVPNATAKDMLALLRDFHHWSGHYAPDVVSSHALRNEGESTTLAIRFKKRIVISIVLDAEYKAEARLTGNDRGYSISRSTHFWQVDDPGTAQERHRPEGEDDGFLWRLNSYWSFAQAEGVEQGRIGEGLLIECEAVSLTRDVPVGLGWLITPIIGNLPRELLTSAITATKNALAAGAAREAN
jgi:hypothetical protein